MSNRRVRYFEERSFFIYLKSCDRLIRVSLALLPYPVGLLSWFSTIDHRRHHGGGGSTSAGGGGPNNFLTRGFPREFPVRFRAESPRHLHSLRVVCRAVYLLVISYAVLLGRKFPQLATLRSIRHLGFLFSFSLTLSLIRIVMVIATDGIIT